MSLKKFSCVIFLFFIINILDVKSDDIFLPDNRKKLDLLAEFLDNANFRNQIITLLINDHAARETDRIREFSQTVNSRTALIRLARTLYGNLQMTQEQRRRHDFEQMRLEAGLRASLQFIYQQSTRGPFTNEELTRNRHIFMQHLENLYTLQERIILRYELSIVLINLNTYIQFEIQSRAQEFHTQDTVILRQREVEHRTVDQLENDLRTRIYYLQERLVQEDSIDDKFEREVDVLQQRWRELQRYAVLLNERREHNARTYEQNLLKRPPQSPPSPDKKRKISRP